MSYALRLRRRRRILASYDRFIDTQQYGVLVLPVLHEIDAVLAEIEEDGP